MNSNLRFLLSIVIIGLMSIPYSFSQTPSKMNYQAIVRDNAGAVTKNKAVSIRFTILSGSISGPNVFKETHSQLPMNLV